ncbi:guanitoxin biosynthesis heme-dependent pre-guanitoxin N-hydroxylase GntA [Streptomyces griseoluteus]|uniref:guanitoxin biosynthesis heme-dependent pre-guanitoxin N-hydroxylase GntA n=1 Tax=Streptomyces griseoluteus TaxID=29306 RepID=UPI0036CDCFCD
MSKEIRGSLSKEISGTQPLPTDWADWISGRSFACTGGSSSLRQGLLHHVPLNSLSDESAVRKMHSALTEVSPLVAEQGSEFMSLLFTFEDDCGDDAAGFHEELWAGMRSLRRIDRTQGYQQAPGSSSDLRSPWFAISAAETAYFVLGLHPRSDRFARRSPGAGLVFNSHLQFDRLRARGVYEPMKKRIRERERRLQPEANPTSTDFGQATEAPQYSGWIPHGWQPKSTDHIAF